ncbi:hypothetical protein ACTWQF_18050 [Streptomyces sp. 8N114]
MNPVWAGVPSLARCLEADRWPWPTIAELAAVVTVLVTAQQLTTS